MRFCNIAVVSQVAIYPNPAVSLVLIIMLD
jgi:hypothetical protein